MDRDEISKNPVYIAAIQSKSAFIFQFPYNRSQRATLQLRRHPRWGNDVILSFERGQFNCGMNGCQVVVRFDDGDTFSLHASKPEDGTTTSLFIDGYAKFIETLRKANTVSIEAVVYQEGSRTFSFDVKGFNSKEFGIETAKETAKDPKTPHRYP